LSEEMFAFVRTLIYDGLHIKDWAYRIGSLALAGK
jgi:hypothetical protein